MSRYRVKCPFCKEDYVVSGTLPFFCAYCGRPAEEYELTSLAERSRERLRLQDCTVPEGTPNINAADAETINRLTGIGMGTCRRIVAKRDRMGYKYYHPTDLLAVRNVGPITASKAIGTIAFGLPTPTNEKLTEGYQRPESHNENGG